MGKPKTCWGITDGHAGMISQVQGLADAVGLDSTIKICTRRWPWVWLPATFPFVNPLNHLTPQSDSLDPPWPDLLITCGRRQLPYALWIREKSKGKTFCAHIQNPRISPSSLDLVIAPEHDQISGENVVTTQGAIHKITSHKLMEGADQWRSHFSKYPTPYHVVLLGGSTNRFKMTHDVITDLIEKVKGIANTTEGSVLITPSYRTPEIKRLRDEFAGQPNIYFADLTQENPYLGMLGLADYVYVTDDSVNMMCEANMTEKPLYLLTPKGHTETVPARFGKTLVESGIARIYEGSSEQWHYSKINDTEKAAKIIRERIGL